MNTPDFMKKVLWEPFEKQPGWVYLAFALYILVELVSLKVPYVSSELWVVILTPLFYGIGHLIDSTFFKKSDNNERFKLEGLDEARKDARDALKVQEGVYDVLMKLLGKSGRNSQKARVHFQNEFAKSARSAALPFLVAGIYLSYTRDIRFALLADFSPLLMIIGFRLKLRHMRALYMMADDLKPPPKYAVSDLKVEDPDVRDSATCVRLFFWDGTLIASAVLVPDAEKRSGTAVLAGGVDKPAKVLSGAGAAAS